MYFAVHHPSQHSLFHTALLITPGARVQNGFCIEKKNFLADRVDFGSACAHFIKKQALLLLG